MPQELLLLGCRCSASCASVPVPVSCSCTTHAAQRLMSGGSMHSSESTISVHSTQCSTELALLLCSCT